METQATRAQAGKLMFTLAHAKFKLPGEPGFPLGGLFSGPQSAAEQGTHWAVIPQSVALKAKCSTERRQCSLVLLWFDCVGLQQALWPASGL